MITRQAILFSLILIFYTPRIIFTSSPVFVKYPRVPLRGCEPVNARTWIWLCLLSGSKSPPMSHVESDNHWILDVTKLSSAKSQLSFCKCKCYWPFWIWRCTGVRLCLYHVMMGLEHQHTNVLSHVIISHWVKHLHHGRQQDGSQCTPHKQI